MLHVDLENLVDHFGIGPVHDQLDTLGKKRIVDIFQFAFQGQQALFSRNVGEVDDHLDRAADIVAWIPEYQAQQAHRSDDDRQGVLDTDRPDRSAHHDDEGGELHDGTEMPTFQDLAPDDRAERQEHP